MKTLNLCCYAFSIGTAAAILLAGRSQANSTLPQSNAETQAASATPATAIKHVVIIVQENRTVDNLFQFLPGAKTKSYGLDQNGDHVALQPQDLASTYDIKHGHKDFVAAYDGGKMDGWNNQGCTRTCPVDPAYGYVPQAQVQPYYTLASTYAFANNNFQTNQGPSFPAHQYELSGTSTISDGSKLRVAENPVMPGSGEEFGGCSSPPNVTVWLIDQSGNENQTVYPCFQRTTIISEANAAGVSWRYYGFTTSYGFWNGPNALKDIQKSPGYATEDVAPPPKVLTDISNGNLAAITYVTPTAAASDHAGRNNGTGPSWVASVVNAIGGSKYWSNTAIFITWDDWGGWYDHVTPTVRNSYELGFRVPLIVVSPYAKPGYISTVPHEFGSILKFTEETFGLPSMNTTDAGADNLSDCFNFAQAPRSFTKIPSKYDAKYFLDQPISNEQVDD